MLGYSGLAIAGCYLNFCGVHRSPFWVFALKFRLREVFSKFKIRR